MPDSGISDGSTLTSSFYDTYVRQQVVVTCTSATRPTNIEGRMIYETDTDRVLLGTGSGSNWIIMAEPVQSFTPTITNLTVGNGTWNRATYHRSDGWLDLDICFTLGTTSAIAGSLTLTLPVATTNTYFFGPGFQLTYFDTSTNVTYMGTGGYSGSASSITLYVQNASGTYLSGSFFSGTVPVAYANGDVLEIRARYQTQYRYS